MSLAYGKLLLGVTFYSFILDGPAYNGKISWNLHFGDFVASEPRQKILLAISSPIITLLVNYLATWVLDHIRRKRAKISATA
jgi:hypothetical protein